MAQETAPNQGAAGDAPADASAPINEGGPGHAPAGGTSPLDAQEQAGGDPFTEHPELFVGGAFVGGLLLAQVLKRIRQ
jgi:hypothetical protein